MPNSWGLLVIGTAIVIAAGVAGLNAAAHRKAERAERAFSALLWLLLALFAYETWMAIF